MHRTLELYLSSWFIEAANVILNRINLYLFNLVLQIVFNTFYVEHLHFTH